MFHRHAIAATGASMAYFCGFWAGGPGVLRQWNPVNSWPEGLSEVA